MEKVANFCNFYKKLPKVNNHPMGDWAKSLASAVSRSEYLYYVRLHTQSYAFLR
jgi:hypothetical protein